MKITAKSFVNPVVVTAAGAAAFLLSGSLAPAQETPAPQRPNSVPPAPASARPNPSTPDRIAVVFTGGHETDARDRGRPVALIAAALGVSSDVFRKAFSGVTPATGGREPEPGQVHRNKAALLQELRPYGIDNERLDAVSDYYRYNGSRGEMWRNTPAQAYATVRNGGVTGFTITNPGSGYSSAPKVTIPGVASRNIVATLAFSADFRKNGSIKSLTLGEDSRTNRPAKRTPKTPEPLTTK